jgi:hypothetical protein
VTRREGTRGTLGEGTHIGTLDVGRARVVRDGIRVAGSEHGWGELKRTGLHEHARIIMVLTMSRWPPVGGHPAVGGGNRSATWKGAGAKCVGGWC